MNYDKYTFYNIINKKINYTFLNDNKYINILRTLKLNI